MRVLVIVAHPDDEVLGCGGTIIKHVDRGDDVSVVVLADGVTARMYDPTVSRKDELGRYRRAINVRKNELLRAVEIMGVKENNLFFYELPDQRLDNLPLLDTIKIIENVSAMKEFDVIYTHHWGDINKDHRICFEAVLTAFRPKKISKRCVLYCFEIPGNMNLLWPITVNRFKPDHFVDITGTKGRKIAALLAYVSEALSPAIVEKLAVERGKRKRMKYAEAFKLVAWGNNAKS